MSRKNIFQKMQEIHNYDKEILRIESLLNKDKCIAIKYTDLRQIRYHYYNIQSFVDKYLFLEWKNRGNYISCNEMRNDLQINRLVYYCESGIDVAIEDLFDYLEYVANILNLIKICKWDNENNVIDKQICKAIINNIKNILETLNYEIYKIDDQKIIVVEKNPAATAVAEIMDENIAYKVIQYNHYLLKGDIEAKKRILLVLGNKLEPQRSQLKSLNNKLETNIFFMLNNMNLRHNNCDINDEKRYKNFVAEMSKDKLENYYDELYQMILLAFLLIDNINRTKEIENLKIKIGGQQ